MTQRAGIVRGGVPGRPVAAPAFPLDPNGPIIKNLKQGHHHMDIQPEFPPDRRRDDSQRNSEAEVYNQPARSGHPRPALHELTATPEAPELDSASGSRAGAGSTSRSRAAGNPWTGASGPSRPSINGKGDVPCPLTQIWDAAIAVRDAVNRALGFKVFIIPVLLFTDTPQNPLIEERAGQRRGRSRSRLTARSSPACSGAGSAPVGRLG